MKYLISMHVFVSDCTGHRNSSGNADNCRTDMTVDMFSVVLSYFSYSTVLKPNTEKKGLMIMKVEIFITWSTVEDPTR